GGVQAGSEHEDAPAKGNRDILVCQLLRAGLQGGSAGELLRNQDYQICLDGLNGLCESRHRDIRAQEQDVQTSTAQQKAKKQWGQGMPLVGRAAYNHSLVT